MLESRRQRNRESVVEEKGQRQNCGGCREVKRTQPQLCCKEELDDNKAVLLLLKKVQQHNRFGLVEKRGRQRNSKCGGGGEVGETA